MLHPEKSVPVCNQPLAGGWSPGTNSTLVPDYVDLTVASWIQAETAVMDAAWGPGETRSALAFMHIPPYVTNIL